jgi:hypothetical protein
MVPRTNHKRVLWNSIFPDGLSLAIVSGCPEGPWCSRSRRAAMAKGQQRSNKEARKPKKPKVKTNVSNPSQKGSSGGLGKKD